MSNETRTIRPFLGLEGLAGTFDRTVLYFGQDACLPGQSLTVDLMPHDFRLRPVVLEWAPDEETFTDFKKGVAENIRTAGMAGNPLSLLATASTSFLKLTEKVFELGMEQLGELSRTTDLSAGERPSPFCAAFSGFTVDLYLLLSEDLRPAPLRPFVKGTWLASSRYRIETTRGPALLPPTPLTDEIRERLGLPTKTLRYIYFGDHDVLQPYSEQEQPVFYIDDKVLAQLNARRRAAGSRALQLQLALDFTATVIRRAFANPEVKEVGYDDLRMSLLGSVIRIAAGPGASESDRQRVLSKVREDPDYAIARAEHFIDVASGFSDALKEDRG